MSCLYQLLVINQIDPLPNQCFFFRNMLYECASLSQMCTILMEFASGMPLQAVPSQALPSQALAFTLACVALA